MTASWVRGVLFFGLPAAALALVIALFGFPQASRDGAQNSVAQTSAGPNVAASSSSVTNSAATPSISEVAKVEPNAVQAAPKPEPLHPVSAKPATPPSFDIVRVEPSGDVIIAGRAEPGSSVVLLRNSQNWAEATANAAGQFAMTPNALGAGTHELSLMMTTKEGLIEASRQMVTVDVPTNRDGEVVIALVAPDKPTVLLSPQRSPLASKAVELKPAEKQTEQVALQHATPAQEGATGPAAATPPTPVQARGTASIGIVEAEDSGTLFASGSAQPGASVRLYLNDSYLATAVAGPDGRWSFSIGKGLTEGSYKVRIDDVEKDTGKVLSRAEVGFDFHPRKAVADASDASKNDAAKNDALKTTTTAKSAAAGTSPADVHVPEIKTATVSRGDSLWRISQRVYGSGERYTVIHRANNAQIRNPDLIYPGQVFVLPGEKQN